MDKGKAMRQRGFTLIELMIVVAVVAILAAIAYPAYNDSVRKSRRAQVKSDLVELAQRAERFHTSNNSYVGFWATVPTSHRISPRTGGTAAYSLTQVEAANSFTLSATPEGTQTKDTRCGTLSLSHTGQKTENGTGTLADCW
ncbi:type IV pilin protein [Luteimonas sp. MJ250]|uniref:type IV pilin protein n=1 Tax=Luteimonas sp. MJ250 TaxID=3129236 RepID=UPI0031BBC44D